MTKESDFYWNNTTIQSMTTDHIRNTLKYLWTNKDRRLATRGQWNNLVLELMGRKLIGSPLKGEPLFKNETTKEKEVKDIGDYADCGVAVPTTGVSTEPRIVKRELSLDGKVWSPVTALSREQLFDLLHAGKQLELRQDVVKAGDVLPSAGDWVLILARETVAS